MLTFIQTDQDDLDVLFVVDQDHCVRRVVRGEIEINEPRELEGVIDLPYEIVHQIVFYKFLTCLIMKQFEEAFRWISFSKTMIRRIYYGVYGHSDIGWFEKLQRLSRTFDMIAAIHHEFFMDRWGGHEMFSIPAMTFPAIVMEYNTDYFLKNTVFYPWEFSSYASIVDIGGLFDHGVIKNLGYHYIDRAALYNPH